MRPASPEKAVHRVRVIDAVQIQRMAANNLGDALRNELNIQLSQDNILGTSMAMQGLGGQNVKLLDRWRPGDRKAGRQHRPGTDRPYGIERVEWWKDRSA
jgi:hypothetical protein